jgi:hypothetical protein
MWGRRTAPFRRLSHRGCRDAAHGAQPKAVSAVTDVVCLGTGRAEGAVNGPPLVGLRISEAKV